MNILGSHCEEFQSTTAVGYLCTCNTSKCNSIEKGKELMEKAEKGVVGEGVECHVCQGDGGLCQGESDEGSVENCGSDIRTCSLAKSSKNFKNQTTKLSP